MPKKKGLIDEKDRKILVELDNNSRQTDSEIAKKVGISKQVANYRIQKLIDSGVISNFYTVVNVGNLGLNTYYIFLKLENMDKKKEKKILEKINSLDYVGWLISCFGRWDVVININADSVSNLDKYLNQIINICGNNLYEYLFTTLVNAKHMGYRFLRKLRHIEPLPQGEKEGIFKLDTLDEKILRILSQDARLSLTEISKKAKLPFHISNYHLKNLIKKRIIEGFKPKLNINKLGYQWYFILIRFSPVTNERRKEFIKFCENHDKIYYLTNTVGSYNLMLDIHLENTGELKEFLVELKDKFSDIIRLYDSVEVFEEYKIDYIPKGIVTTALLFDLDGTLVDTEKFDIKILGKVLKKYGIKTSEKFAGRSLKEYLSKIIKDKNLIERVEKEFIKEYEIAIKNVQLEINQELLKYVRLGKDPLVALVTANNKRLTSKILKKTKLSKYFDVIITTENVKHQKPHPEPYLKAMKELNVDPKNCIAFEDSEIGVSSAKAADIKIVRKINYFQ